MNLEGCHWVNAPKNWKLSQNTLKAITDEETDFWRNTYYGFTRHNGHAFGSKVKGDFTLQLCIEAKFDHLYDQAGLLIQDSEENWVKTGVEYNDEAPAVSCVVTRNSSDWSTGLFEGCSDKFWMRATLENHALRIQYSSNGKTWPLLRLLEWNATEHLFVGAMCCTPERGGLEVSFSNMSLGPPLGKSLHDLS